MLTFIKSVRAELLQVTWPNRQETIRLTAVVIIISVFVGVYLGVVDFGFAKLLEFIIK
ncbi:MAG: preprotein translocase subunit SecE [Candidatus Levyibacteriota bacterium]